MSLQVQLYQPPTMLRGPAKIVALVLSCLAIANAQTQTKNEDIMNYWTKERRQEAKDALILLDPETGQAFHCCSNARDCLRSKCRRGKCDQTERITDIKTCKAIFARRVFIGAHAFSVLDASSLITDVILNWDSSQLSFSKTAGTFVP